MECQNCHERPASVHYTKIMNGEKIEFHLCDQCAQEKGEMFTGEQSFSLNHLLSGLLNYEHPSSAPSSYPYTTNQPPQTVCSKCGMTYHDFTKVGRFGCANCYETFQEKIEPILRRVHSGNTVHAGKIPKRIGSTLHLRKEIAALRTKMQSYIEQEEFEEAAKVRDHIRSLEKEIHEAEEGEA